MFVGFLARSPMLFDSHKKVQDFLENQMDQSSSIGFVATMGALHEGHLALMKRALLENDFLVVSIFVNPTQFNNPEDLKKYPRILDQDLELMNSYLDRSRYIVYAPAVKDVYEDGTASKSYDFDGLENIMEGAQRPGHFNGVGTVLEFLFNMVQPDKAYFGEKDFQQLQIIKKLVDKLDFDIEIIGCAIEREESGLAMSSRNSRLTPKGLKKATEIFRILKQAKSYFKSHSIPDTANYVHGEFNALPEFTLEYFTIADEQSLLPASSKDPEKKYRAFIVVHLEGVRLIDNIPLY